LRHSRKLGHNTFRAVEKKRQDGGGVKEQISLGGRRRRKKSAQNALREGKSSKVGGDESEGGRVVVD